MKSFYFLLALIASTAALNAKVADGVVRSSVAGIDLLVDRTPVKDVVIIRGTWPAGDACAPADNPSLATLTAGLLDKGTTKRDKFTIARTLEDLGASIRFGAGDSLDAQFTVSCLREDLPTVLVVLAEELRTPAFDPSEFAKYKKQLSAGIRQQTQDTGAQADRAFVRAAFPAGHINRPATFEEWQKAIDAATLEDVKAFHAEHYGTAGMTIVVAGDVDPAEVRGLLEKQFSGWMSSKPDHPTGSLSGTAGDLPREQTIVVPGKTSVDIIIGQATGLRYSDPDTLPLRLGTGILGEGFTGRLMKQVREKEGLTYGISAGVGNDTFADGDWEVTGTFAPQLLERGIASARKVVDEFIAGGVTEAELSAKKTNFIGKQQLGLSTTGGLANALLTTVQRGLPITYLDEFPERVNAISVDEVNNAIRRHLSTDKLLLIKAGSLSTN